MKRAIILSVACILVTSACAKGSGHSSSSSGSHSVRGYTKRDGTYVAPAHATNSDGNKSNNWTTKGNVNPYTGKHGTKED